MARTSTTAALCRSGRPLAITWDYEPWRYDLLCPVSITICIWNHSRRATANRCSPQRHPIRLLLRILMRNRERDLLVSVIGRRAAEGFPPISAADESEVGRREKRRVKFRVGPVQPSPGGSSASILGSAAAPIGPAKLPKGGKIARSVVNFRRSRRCTCTLWYGQQVCTHYWFAGCPKALRLQVFCPKIPDPSNVASQRNEPVQSQY